MVLKNKKVIGGLELCILSRYYRRQGRGIDQNGVVGMLYVHWHASGVLMIVVHYTEAFFQVSRWPIRALVYGHRYARSPSSRVGLQFILHFRR